MKHDIEFDADGTLLRGWLYVPDVGEGPHPAVVMTHGLSAIKEMGLDRYAEVFCAAGFAALVYDNRNLGASAGEPRWEIDPTAQMRDFRHAITFAQCHPEIDPDRVGLWGTSFSGGLALIAAALDRRVKCVVSQCPYISGFETMAETMSIEQRAHLQRLQDEERRLRSSGSRLKTVPVCSPESPEPTDRSNYSFGYFTGFSQDIAENWGNKITLRSRDMRLEYEAMPYVERVSPTPLLMIVATHDTVTPTRIALKAYHSALEPKSLLVIAGGHYTPYLEGFGDSSAAATKWFEQYLGC